MTIDRFSRQAFIGVEKVSIEEDTLVGRFTVPLRKCAEADLIKFALVRISPRSGFRRVTFDSAARCTAVTSALHVVLCGINQRRCGII